MKLSLLRKGAAKAKQAKAQAKGRKPPQARGPRQRKIGIFGHSRSGKTVFLTMLWHKTHGRRDFSLETDDYQTRQDMSSYYDLLAAGQWPPPTATERLYRFTAVIDSTIRYPFESQDYQGESVSIDREVEAGKEFLEYFEGCDCVFVLVDADDLVIEGDAGAAQRRKKIDSFELMLAQLVEGTRNRLKIPVAIVVTKSDLLDGFRGEDQVVLVGDDIRYSRYRGYESFVSAVLQQKHVSQHLPWRDQVENVLLLLRPLIDYCLTKSPDLQVFFISSTGGVERVTGEGGAKATRPPANLQPVGLERPFVWSVRLLMQKRRALIARKVKWWLAAVAALFIAVFSLINWWQEAKIQGISKLAGIGVGGGSPVERVSALEGYRNSLLAGFFKPDFRETVDLILDYERARALSQRMQEAVEAIEYERFGEARRSMQELRDEFPAASQEYRSCDQTIERREQEWDRAYGDYRLRVLLAGSGTGAAEFENSVKMLFRLESKEEWRSRWHERQSLTQGQLRRQDLSQILGAISGLSGNSWKALDRIDDLSKLYLESFVDDLNDAGEWRPVYLRIRALQDLIARALEAQESPQELGGIALQLHEVDAIEGQDVGARVASHLGRLSSDAVAANAAEMIDRLRQDLESGSLEFRFSDSYLSRLRRFVRDYNGTPEAQRVSRFLREMDSVVNTGIVVTVEVSECPPGHHLRLWNHEVGSWDPADVEPQIPGRLRWKPGETVRIGLEKTDPHNVGNNILDEWVVSDRWALLKIQEDGGRHVFAGNRAVEIGFSNLESSLPGF